MGSWQDFVGRLFPFPFYKSSALASRPNCFPSLQYSIFCGVTSTSCLGGCASAHSLPESINTNGELRAKFHCGIRGGCVRTGLNETLRVSTLVLYSPQTLRRHSPTHLVRSNTQQRPPERYSSFQFFILCLYSWCSSPSHPIPSGSCLSILKLCSPAAYHSTSFLESHPVRYSLNPILRTS
jgi:hypothetical protein